MFNLYMDKAFGFFMVLLFVGLVIYFLPLVCRVG